jgi:hypothetical protein
MRRGRAALAPAAVVVAVAALAAGCGGTTHDAQPPPVALLTRVRVATGAGCDHVTFVFRSRPLWVSARYEKRSALVEDGSGRHVRVAGAAFLVLRFRPASGFDLSRAGDEATYRGARRIRPRGARVVRELVRLGDYEATLTWALGLAQRRPYLLLRIGSSVSVVIRAPDARTPMLATRLGICTDAHSGSESDGRAEGGDQDGGSE